MLVNHFHNNIPVCAQLSLYCSCCFRNLPLATSLSSPSSPFSVFTSSALSSVPALFPSCIYLSVITPFHLSSSSTFIFFLCVCLDLYLSSSVLPSRPCYSYFHPLHAFLFCHSIALSTASCRQQLSFFWENFPILPNFPFRFFSPLRVLHRKSITPQPNSIESSSVHPIARFLPSNLQIIDFVFDFHICALGLKLGQFVFSWFTFEFWRNCETLKM